MDKKFLENESKRLTEIVEQSLYRFKNIEDWDSKPAPNKWSKKEILGHLIDSAANNHLRFIRAQLAEGVFVSFGYEQDFYVLSQNYQGRNAEDVIALWKSYNLHLAHVIKNMKSEKLKTICRIGNYDPNTLAFLVTDYSDHQLHHLAFIK